MANNVKENIMVLAFPRDEFKRDELNKLNDKELFDLAVSYSHIEIWPTLLAFQYASNSGIVDINNYWIYFKEKGKKG